MPSTKPRARLEHVLDQPWALYPQTLSRIVEWARDGAEQAIPAELAERDGAHDRAQAGDVARTPYGVRAGSVAIIAVYGVIEQHTDAWMEWFGGTSVDGLREDLQAALADPEAKAIVLDVDSPGGTVAGITELAAEIRALRGGDKPIVASANSFCASAAYWLASQCDEVTATPSAQVGSIGVYAVHQDVSRMLDEMGVTVTLVSAGPHKTDGNMYEPLGEDAKADMQARVNDTYATFKGDVAAGRRISADQVEADFGGGRVLTAKKAAAAGMVDRVETLGATVVRLGSTGGRRRVAGAKADAPEVDLVAASTIPDEPLTVEADDSPADGLPPFSDRLAALAAEADSLVDHATERARLRGKEGRPAFSTTTERSLRSIRGAIDSLLEPDEPAASTAPPDPVEPAPAAPSTSPVTAAPTQPRFPSRDAWLHYMESHQ